MHNRWSFAEPIVMQRRLVSMLIVALCWSVNAHAAALTDLEFMAGRWVIDNADGTIEEYWMAPSGKTMVAAFRWVQGVKLLTVELVIVSEEPDGVHLRFKHFGADYEPWEKDAPNRYRLESVVNHRAVFKRLSEGSAVPSYLVYHRNGDELRFIGTEHPDGNGSDDDLFLIFTLRR